MCKATNNYFMIFAAPIQCAKTEMSCFMKIFLFIWSLLWIISCISCNGIEKDAFIPIEPSYYHASFVGAESCAKCHQKEFHEWNNSHHDLAMQLADSTTILADFNNTSFTHNGVKSSFFKKGKEYFVNTEGEDGSYQDFKVVYTFGISPLQQYIVEFPNGEYNCLLTAWDTEKNIWFYLQPDLEIKHDEWINWSGGSQRWNTMCADCHSTDVKKNYNLETGTYKTTFSEINVACESCHGPASEHVSFYEDSKNLVADGAVPPELYMNREMSSEELVDKCARCHARRTTLTPYFDYKGTFADHFFARLLEDPLYESDGQIRDEVYVYGSFIQSKMYEEGVSCKDCHNVHSLKLKEEGNDLCLSCHTPNYNTESHHFHPVSSKGSLCINCHMDGKLYMGNDYRRDHSFRIPRPDQSVTYNTPNACNKCHEDKSAAWAANIIRDKFGPDRADHFSDHLLKGYAGEQDAFKKVFTNRSYPDIARATALGRFADSPISYEEALNLTLYLNDTSVFVRNETIRSLERIAVPEFSEHVVPLLRDSIRAIRISAAHYFHTLSTDLVKESEAFKKATKEYETELYTNSDFPAGLNQLGVYEQGRANAEKAMTYYQKAIEEDSYNNRARMNLALLYYQQGRIEDTEILYLKVLEQEPDFSYVHYMLGLLYNETGNTEKALLYLSKATSLDPPNQNAFYNYALLLQQQKNNKASIEITNKGLALFPFDERLLYVKLLGQLNLNLRYEALETLEILIQLNPNNGDYRQLKNQLLGGS